MKRTILSLALLVVTLSASATDSLFVKSPQLPILTDRADNILFELRIPAQKNDVLNQIELQFGKLTDLSQIEAVRLYYSGIESKIRKGENFRPLDYFATLKPGKARVINSSYSVKQDEASHPGQTLSLHSKQPLLDGINYFWVSIQMKPDASLLNKIDATIPSALINKQAAVITWKGKNETKRLGLGLRQAGDDGVEAYRIPGLATTCKGTLIGIYDIRYNGSMDLQESIDIGVSRSTDKGQTWEPMRKAMSFGESNGLPSAQNGVGDPCVLVDETTNTIWIAAAWCHGMGGQRAWFSSMPGLDKDQTAQLMLVKSEDDGKTWSEPIDITSQVKDPSWHFLLQGPGRGITMQDGTLVFPAQFIDADRIPHSCIIYSKDHGKHWQLHNGARTKTTESQVAEIEPGVLMLNMRDDRGGSRAVSITKDMGQTWTEHPTNRSALQESVCMASLLKVGASENYTGKQLLLFSNPNTTKDRNHITIKASFDNGMTWPQEYQLLLDEDEGWGYSCLTMIDKETVGILYESSVSEMTFQKVKLKDIIKQ